MRRPRKDERVTLHVPENIKLHGAEGVVTHLAEWGAHVLTNATETGTFRATWDEMRVVPPKSVEIKSLGYTGDICDKCQGQRMVRSGSCLTCLDCNDSSGCS